MALLELDNVRIRFGGVQAVDGCTFHVKEGEIVGLIGPNGAGKTTVFDLITGYLTPDSGQIRYRGRRIDGSPPHIIARQGVGRTFQIIRNFPTMSARDNLVMAFKDHPGETLLGGFFGGWRGVEQQHLQRARELMDLVGIRHREDVPAGNLSYGQQKLLEIARVIALGTDLFLLDEPMAGVNPAMRRKLLDLIGTLRKQGKTFLIVEHDLNFIMGVSDRIVVLDYGHVIADGTPAEVRDNARVVEAYLGVKRRDPNDPNLGGANA
ncbi:MAG TPA: ABC transporter ATP-binding protein [Candidatus Thermoplasmatota archaeon]|nr:ABC transporter ATP-binding protein [Candidatus Thermoplasmatota archaeon]